MLGLKGPRKMTVIIPGIYLDKKDNYLKPTNIRPVSVNLHQSLINFGGLIFTGKRHDFGTFKKSSTRRNGRPQQQTAGLE